MTDPVTRLNSALEGRYRIERQLGEGGMATVYLGYRRRTALRFAKEAGEGAWLPTVRARVGRILTLLFLNLSGCGGTESPTNATMQQGTVADPVGGAVSLADGAVTLVLPASAVGEAVVVTAEPAKQLPADPARVLGTAFNLGPDGLVFDQPVILTIEYDPANVPSGIPEVWLRLRRIVDGAYVPVDSAVVDTANHTVSGTIYGFSTFAVVASPSVVPELTHPFSHTSGGLESSATVGIWMFSSPENATIPALLTENRTKPELKVQAIAEWLGVPLVLPGGIEQDILEPINVMWIDYTAENHEEARGNVQDYLEQADFELEAPGSSLFPNHSYGYWGWYDGGMVTDMVRQWPATSTWVDALQPTENNHGRVFATVNVGTEENPAFYTLGAFSRESSRDEGHKFLSFDAAQQAVLVGAAVGDLRFGWTYERFDTDRTTIPGCFSG